MTRGMRRAWQVATSVMLALCLFMIQQSLQLSLTDRLGPGPGFFPLWLALIGAVLAGLLLLRTSLVAAGDDESPAILPRGDGARGIVAILAALAVAAALMTVLGFRLSMLLFIVGLVVMLGERRWWAALLFGLAGSFGVFYVFNNMLDVILPVGVLGL